MVNSPRALLTVDHVCTCRSSAVASPIEAGSTKGSQAGIHHHRRICFPVIHRPRTAGRQGSRRGGGGGGYLHTAAAGWGGYTRHSLVAPLCGDSSCESRAMPVLLQHHPKMTLSLQNAARRGEALPRTISLPCPLAPRPSAGLGIEDCNASLNAFNAIVQSKASASVRPPFLHLLSSTRTRTQRTAG